MFACKSFCFHFNIHIYVLITPQQKFIYMKKYADIYERSILQAAERKSLNSFCIVQQVWRRFFVYIFFCAFTVHSTEAHPSFALEKTHIKETENNSWCLFEWIISYFFGWKTWKKIDEYSHTDVKLFLINFSRNY